ncbi:MAG: Fe-S cluster assembly protein HesB [Candidatus Gottesmanbacteria bacterium]|nr:Fe-S cluster assembly protein HesB [Candidatus Gottesmanbacteria bacterium]
MKIGRIRITKFQARIFSWWELNKRDLPWRHTHDPYKILVSEVMLQQTQVSRVLPKYEEFLYFFPDVYTLAKASLAKLLKVWRGMGYNRRALYLKKAAQTVVDTYNGEFPENEKELVTLPGLGIYTARAILVFAYSRDIAAVDTNIRRIITHFFFNDVPQKEKIIQEVADKLVPMDESWEWHQALMDFGAAHNSLFSIHNSKINKKKIPFQKTNRYYRGRLIDILREGPVDEHILVKVFSASIINGLLKDGLVERKKGMLRLPD